MAANNELGINYICTVYQMKHKMIKQFLFVNIVV